MGETITLTASDGHQLSAYKAAPAGQPKGGLVVVQEIFGVNSHIRDVCDRYAAQGYLAVAPAVYDRVERDVELGYGPDDMARGRDIRAETEIDDVIKDVEAAAAAAAAGGKVGIVGYCWGGSVVYVACCRLGGKITAGSGYYGGQILPHLHEKPEARLILHFAENDGSIPLGDVDQIIAARPDVSVHVYLDADHGFNCDQRSQYNPDVAKLAEQRTLALFEKELAG